MFVKIVYDDGRELLRQCKEVSITNIYAEDSTQKEAILIACDDSFPRQELVTYLIEKDSANVYFMNDDGKTIDSYQRVRSAESVSSVTFEYAKE